MASAHPVSSHSCATATGHGDASAGRDGGSYGASLLDHRLARAIGGCRGSRRRLTASGRQQNVTPDEAVIKLNVRTCEEGVRARVLAAMTRIVNAQKRRSPVRRSSGNPITPLDRYSLVTDDRD
jgi:acetylornithine deacetylase/succinyl-diaminopimelate desuccinylase-like protein